MTVKVTWDSQKDSAINIFPNVLSVSFNKKRYSRHKHVSLEPDIALYRVSGPHRYEGLKITIVTL